MKRRSLVLLGTLFVWLVTLAIVGPVSAWVEEPGTITVHKFNDVNSDGTQNAGESDIEGWKIRIYRVDSTGPHVVREETTGPDGTVTFTDLTAGHTWYKVWEEARECWEPTAPDDIGSYDGGYYVSRKLYGPDHLDIAVDFGNHYTCGSIGDTVWQDDDGDGVQDADEPGIPDITVDLNEPGPDGICDTDDDVFIASDVTDANGNYLFTDLSQGSYCVDPDETTVPAGYELTTANDPETVDLGPGEDYLDADFGYRPLYTLGDRVWYDQDQDGIQDPNEPGYNGVTVDLYDNATCSGTPIASTTTGATGPDGYYQFTDLPAGTYCVQFGNIPAGWSISPANQGADDTVDSDANASAQIPNISLTADDPDEDMGIYVAGSLGDSVVCVSTGEGLANITISLYEDFDCDGTADGPAIATTETDATGFYQFSGLEVALAGDPNNQTCYVVAVDVNDADLGTCSVPIPPTEYNPSLDSDNPDDPNNDFSFEFPRATLGDTVWEDTDRDGVQDADEPGIEGVTVNLYDCDGNLIVSDTTDADGNYLFDGLTPGCYEVEFVAPMGYVFSPQDQGADDALDSDADPATGLTGSIDLAPGETDLDWDAGLYTPTCDLVVNKSCLVPASTTDLSCTDKIVATTLRYIGPTILGATVEIDPDKSPTVVYSGIDLISDETVLTLAAENGFSVDAQPDEQELGAKTKIRIDGVEEVIHTSCSTPYVAGQPAPLDDPKGDPSPNWFVENFVDKDSPEVVEVPAPQPSDSCEITLSPTPSCETEDKPNSLTFIFTGGTCADSANTQGSKFTCTDYAPIDPSLPVEIVYVGKDPDKFTITPDVVMVGEELVIDTTRADFHAETKLELYQDGALVQFLNIHTSCSAPLVVGDVFGGLELVAFNGQRAGAEVTYLYEVTNLGDALTDVTLTDQVNGATVFSAGPFDLLTSDPMEFEWVTEITETTVNTATFSGFLANGAVCSAGDFATVTVVEPCAECKGGTTELTFQYLGTQAANVVVYDDKDAKADKILFEGLLQPGDEFTVTPRLGQDKLNNDISIWVDGAFNAKVHTSCSQPIGPGLIAGDFEIIEGRSKDNGLMCPLNTCAPDAASAIEFHDQEIRWDVTNVGDLGLEISRIEISWPEANGYLDEVKREGDAIHKGDFPPPSAVIDSDWEGNPDKRTIKPGETDTLKFKFQNDAVLDGAYNIVVEFTYGCSIEVSYTPPVSGAYFDCSKPIDSLTMIWNGATTDVWVTAWYGDVGSTVLTSLIPVSLGAELTVSGYAGSPNDVYWEIFTDAAGTNKLGESIFHLSCSDDDMNDAQDCGKAQGDGKGQSGFYNDWLLEGLVDSDETLNCTSP